LTLSAAPATTSEVIAGLFTYHDAGGNQTTAGTGWTALSDDNKYLTQVRGSSTSTDVLFDEAGSSQGGSAAVALEIKEAGSGGSGGTLMNIIIT
jgi:hypothetical protein